jgi:hypothetical protein
MTTAPFVAHEMIHWCSILLCYGPPSTLALYVCMCFAFVWPVKPFAMKIEYIPQYQYYVRCYYYCTLVHSVFRVGAGCLARRQNNRLTQMAHFFRL